MKNNNKCVHNIIIRLTKKASVHNKSTLYQKSINKLKHSFRVTLILLFSVIFFNIIVVNLIFLFFLFIEIIITIQLKIKSEKNVSYAQKYAILFFEIKDTALLIDIICKPFAAD